MFRATSLFQTIQCPERGSCKRSPCLFSHDQLSLNRNKPIVDSGAVLVDLSASSPSDLSHQDSAGPSSAPKRPANVSPTGTSPPRKVLKVSDAQDTKPTPAPRKTPLKRAVNPVPAGANIGPPILRISAGASKIPVPERQKMVTRLYEEFLVLYRPLGPKGATLATEHAFAQEIEIYEKTNAKTYKNATINALVSLKKRPPPNAPSHSSVGTELQVHARAAAAKEYSALKLLPEDLTSFLLTLDEMREWGYVVEVPDDWGSGGDQVSEVGNIIKCDRCANEHTCMEDFGEEECQFHWGRPWSTKVAGGLPFNTYITLVNRSDSIF
ncbi:RNA exonuclease 3 [Tulasnella sp. 330]|nr:RNA exonuclease 3 [Tulasnella sp. 330]KAG8882937.1 RNA exonuclease 3 [Tulasnella sp. 331]